MNRGGLLARRPAAAARQDVRMSATPVVCPRCSNVFECGVDTGSCWCADASVNDITRASLVEFYDGCLCADCLKTLEDARPPVPTVRAFLASQLRLKRRRRA